MTLCFSFLFACLGLMLVPMVNADNTLTEEKPAIMLVGISCHTSNSPDAAPVDIPKLWGKFIGENTVSQIPNKASNEVIALYCDYEGDYTQPYTIVIGCPTTSLDNIPEGMVGKVIPASSYAIFPAAGEQPKATIDAWGKIWQTDLKRTYTGDFELYSGDFLSGSSNVVDVYIAIEN